MISFLRHNVPIATLMQLVAELSWLFVAAVAAILFLERISIPAPVDFLPQIIYAVMVVSLNIGFGLYRRKEKLARSTYFTRVCIASTVGTVLAYIVAGALPG